MVDLNKAGERAVIGPFHLRREDTGGEFVILQVVGDTIAALSLAGAGFIGAVAFCFIGFYIAFH